MVVNILELKNRWLFVLWAFMPVVLGLSIYVLWRPETIRLFGWLELVGLGSCVGLIRSYSIYVYDYIPEWIIFSLPNGLWAFSYAFIITALWWGSNSKLKYLWLGSIPVLGLGYEIMQYPGVIRGVFCLQDLVICFIGIVLGTTISAMAGMRSVKP